MNKYLTPNEIKKKYHIDPTHVRRDLMDKGCRTKEYLFCNRKCLAYYEPDVQAIVRDRQRRKRISQIRYKSRPNVIRGLKSEYKNVIDQDIYRKLRNAWYGMLRRCYTDERKDYHHYRKMGISVCDEWLDNFDNFVLWSITHGVKMELSLDRIDNDKGYTPENCRWVTAKVQNNNSSMTHRIIYQGEEKTLSEWAEFLGISRKTLYARIFTSNWSVEKALTTPVKHLKRLQKQPEQ